MIYRILVSITLFASTQIASNELLAQDKKGSWLKKSVDKEAGKAVQKKETADSDSLNILLNYLKPDSIAPAKTDNSVVQTLQKTGKVTVIADYGVELLNDSLARNPEPIKGFRIQIFFGTLDQSKTARANFIRNHPDIPCNIEQITPSFSVRAGNFRNQHEAHKVLNQLKADYPSAIVVSDEIDLPVLPPREN